MQDSQTQPRLLSLREAAERLNVSESTLWLLVRRGALRSVRLTERGSHRFTDATLAEFIAQREAATAAACRCGRKGGCSR